MCSGASAANGHKQHIIKRLSIFCSGTTMLERIQKCPMQQLVPLEMIEDTNPPSNMQIGGVRGPQKMQQLGNHWI